jgi:hypothetical protein
LRKGEANCRSEKKHQRQHHQARDLKHIQETPSADDDRGETGQHDTTGEASEFLKRLHAADGLFLRGARQRADLRETGHHARHLLDGTERGGVGARHHDRRHDRRPAKRRPEQFCKAGPLERAGRLLQLPGR